MRENPSQSGWVTAGSLPHPDLGFDIEIFELQSTRLVKVRQTRYRIDPEKMFEDLFPDEISGLRELPVTPLILLESGFARSTSGSGAGSLSMISRSWRSNGGTRISTGTRTSGETLLRCYSQSRGYSGGYPFSDLFSDGEP